MPPKKHDPSLKSKASGLLSAAEVVLLEASARAMHFEDSQDFKRSILKALDVHPAFEAAVRKFHTPQRLAAKPIQAKGSASKPQGARVQGSRVERGVRDRKGVDLRHAQRGR